MPGTVESDPLEGLFLAVRRQLQAIGYKDDLIKTDYTFPDYFSPLVPKREAPAVAFGQLTLDYHSACFVVAKSNGRAGPELLAHYRALGARRAFEVRHDRVLRWRASVNASNSGVIL